MNSFYAYNSVSSDLKWRPRLKIFASGALEYRPDVEEAWSYRWCFLKRINGKLVFNLYAFSQTTKRHQSTMISFLKQKRIKVDVFIVSVESLRTPTVGTSALISELKDAIKNPRPNLKNAYKIAKIFKLKLTKRLIAETIENMENMKCHAFLSQSVLRQEKKIQDLLKRLDAPTYYGPAIETDTSSITAEVFPCAA